MTEPKHEGNGRLEEVSVQNEATFQAEIAEINRQTAEYKRQIAETGRINVEIFGRIEALLLKQGRILAEHGRILRALPDAICEKLSFKMSPPPK